MKLNFDIINYPEDAKDYEFVVIKEGDEGKYWFWGKYTNREDAEQAANECGGVILHDVRIQGHRNPEPEPKPKEKYYEFRGYWTWACWATSQREACEKYEEADVEEFDIDLYDPEIREF